MSALVIIGTGLFPEIAKLYFDKYTEYEVVAFACHRKYQSTKELYGLPLVCIEDMFNDYPPSKFTVFVAVGYKNMNNRITNYIDKTDTCDIFYIQILFLPNYTSEDVWIYYG